MASAGEKKDTKKESQAKGASKSAFMAPLNPDAVLAEIVGPDPIPRTEATKRVWDYIREHNLQDPNDRRTIKADLKLRRVFGGKDAVTMFELTKLVNHHLSTLPGGPSVGSDKKKEPVKKPVDRPVKKPVKR